MGERLRRIRNKALVSKQARLVLDMYDEGLIGVTEAFKQVFYKTPTIVCSDCLAYLKTIPNDTVSLVLTDPPYDISKETGFQSCVNGNKKFMVSMDFGEWDHGSLDLEATVKELYRVTNKGGTAIIWYDVWKISELKTMMESAGFKQIRLIEWIKTNPVPINSKVNYLTNAREVAVLGIKGSKPTFNSSFDKGIYEYPIYQGNDRFHPTQKPVKLMEDLILKHSNEGDVVLDVFLGSGTTAVAAINTGRHCMGCEIDQEMFNKAKQRLKAYE